MSQHVALYQVLITSEINPPLRAPGDLDKQRKVISFTLPSNTADRQPTSVVLHGFDIRCR